MTCYVILLSSGRTLLRSYHEEGLSHGEIAELVGARRSASSNARAAFARGDAVSAVQIAYPPQVPPQCTDLRFVSSQNIANTHALYINTVLQVVPIRKLYLSLRCR